MRKASMEKLLADYERVSDDLCILDSADTTKKAHLETQLKTIAFFIGRKDIDKKDKKDHIMEMQHDNLDLSGRKIWIRDEFIGGDAARFEAQISAIFEHGGSERPITLVIDSPGGDVHSCLGMVDIIRNLPCKVNTVATGIAASAAMVLFAAGNGTRKMSKHSFLMYHWCQISWLSGNSGDIQNQAVFMESLTDKLTTVIAEACTEDHGFDWWKPQGNKEMFVSTEDALKYGLCTGVLDSTDF
jgi:ATP-dependent protease ClpP protease subunit